jgi:hypothetical protein
MQDKIDIGHPHGKKLFGQEARTGIADQVEVCSWNALNGAPIRQNNEESSMWRVRPATM